MHFLSLCPYSALKMGIIMILMYWIQRVCCVFKYTMQNNHSVLVFTIWLEKYLVFGNVKSNILKQDYKNKHPAFLFPEE